MPEYLAPGVFVEELPASLRAIEGVSTSTAAFVGPTERGPVAGGALPFVPDNGFLLTADPAPALVTSYDAYVRLFGHPLRLPEDTDSEDRGYVGHATRAFFDNGGARLYIARVVAASTWNTAQLGQGVVHRLARRPVAGSSQVVLRSLRAIGVGTALTFLRRTDGTDALVPAATAAVLDGTVVGPFSLANGDTLTVDAGSPIAITILATPVQTTSALAAAPFVISGDLQVRVGGPSEPVQQVSFTGQTTVASVALVLAAGLKGVAVDVVSAGTQVRLRTDVAGTAAAITLVSDTTGALGFGAPLGGASDNVADVDHVTVAELTLLLAGPSFSVGATGGGALHVVSTATGTGVTVTATGTAASKLGLGGPGVPGGGGGAAPVVTVTGYDTPLGLVNLDQTVPALDPNEIYVVVGSAPPTPAGPRFHARSPGSWSRSIRVSIAPADRAAVPIAAAAPGSATAIQVQSATSFYVGAVVEIDHDGVQRTYHEVMGITGTTLDLFPALGTPVGAVPGTTAYARVAEIDLTVSDTSGAAPDEAYRGLSWNPRQTEDILRRHYATQINARSALVYVQPPGVGGLAGTEDADAVSQPTTTTGFAQAFTDSAGDGLPPVGAGGEPVLIGDDPGPGKRTGIQSLQDITDVRIVAVPGATRPAVQVALIAHCERMRYRFAVLDGERDGTDSVNTVLAHRDLYDTSFAAYYTPWVVVSVRGDRRSLPPSAFAAGIYARVDNQRGVWKAPANEVVNDAIDLRTRFTTGEQEVLNPRGVNLIRKFDGAGIRVWGARTLSSNPEVRYVNVRRTLLFIEASIERGTQWVVFEPNRPDTWARVTASIRAFLRTQWRDGALFGRTEAQAFYVRCDESTMTADDVLNGRLICRIGVAIVRPAEFVIFRIEQLTGFANQ